MAHSALEFNKALLPYLNKISQPLKESFDICWFEYIKLFPSGKRLYISNKHEWLTNYLSKNLQDDMKHTKILWGKPKKKYSLWLSLEKTKVFSEHYKNDMWNGLFIQGERDKGFKEIFSFSSHVKNHYINDVYLNEPDVFNKVMFAFHQDIYPKLDLINPNCFITPKNPLNLNPSDITYSSPCNLEEFYYKTKVTKYYFHHGSPNSFYLTRMEFICLNLLSHGQSIKEIASEINISPRTVESHLNAIKNKTGYSCRSKLISILNESPFSFTKDYLKKYLTEKV
jgi:DNA-binding CsgD family transcriptional regulator